MRRQLAPYLRKPPPIFAGGESLRDIIQPANIAYTRTLYAIIKSLKYN